MIDLRTIVIVCLSAILSFQTTAQISRHSTDENFVFEVKHISEFIERFNNEKTLLKEYAQDKLNYTDIDRETMLYGLFNTSNAGLHGVDVERFVEKVMDESDPQYLNFHDQDWYSTIDCVVEYNYVRYPMKIALAVEQRKEGIKWVIAGVDSEIFKREYESSDSLLFLNPASYGTGFMGIEKVFDSQQVEEFLPAEFKDDQLTIFAFLLESGKLKFIDVTHVEYHFLQMENWIFIVRYASRNTKNSGWLIDEIITVDDEAKRIYISEVLGKANY